MSSIDCQRCRDLAPELALGIGSGDDRAAVLDHVAHCAPCERELDELSVAADAVLLASPRVEPPVGFESDVFARIGSDDRRRQSSGRRLLAAAAAVAVVFVAGLGLGFAVRANRADQVAGLAIASDDVIAGSLHDVAGSDAGRVFAYRGEPSWLVVNVGAGVAPGSYEVECEYEHGEVFVAGTVVAEVPNRETTWMAAVPEDLTTLTVVRLLPTGGGTPLTATIAPR